MKSKCYFLWALVVILPSCEPQLEDYLFVPESIETAIVMRSQYISHTSSELIYETDVVLLDNYEFLGDNIIFDDEVVFVNNNGTTQILNFNARRSQAPSGKSSTIVMIDESGSYEETDPANARSQIINKFLNDHQSPDNYILAAFSREGYLEQEPVEYFNDNFSTAFHEPLTYIFDLAKRTGGKSFLYDAVDQALNKFNSASGTNEQREMVILVHASDDGSNAAPSDLLAKAKASNVRLHFIEMANEPDNALVSLSQQTGGFYVACPTSKEMICAFTHFERLLNGESYKHTIRVRYRPAGTTIQSGFELRQTIKVTDSYDGFTYNPAYAYVKVP